jgi:hypothetical protein
MVRDVIKIGSIHQENLMTMGGQEELGVLESNKVMARPSAIQDALIL